MLALAAAAGATSPVGRAAAQEPAAREPAADTLGPAVPCRGQRVSAVVVRAGPPDFSGVARWWPALARTAAELHVTSRDEVVRRFVILLPGQRCSEFRRSESERILRAQPFIADANVTAHDDGAGGVVILAETLDEISAGITVGARGSTPYIASLRLRDQNIDGRAVAANVAWHDGRYYRDGYSVDVTHYQLFGRPYQLAVSGARQSLGGAWGAEASHPYLTDLQRIAWRALGGAQREYFSFRRGRGAGSPAVLTDRHFVDVGGIVHLGEPGRLSLFGATVSRSFAAAGAAPVLLTDSGIVGDTSATLVGRYGALRSARVNALWGVRNVRFMRVRAFDALTAVQDVRVGFQFGTLVGRSLDVLGSQTDDIFVSADVYGGMGSPRAFVAFQLQGEGRQDYDVNKWDGILGSGRAATYLRLSEHHTMMADAEFSAGWRQRVPFQLRLDDPDGGIRGYRGAAVGGARRQVARLEDRWFLGRPRGFADVGIAPFVDVGQLWAGRPDDTPFGVSTGVRAGAGVGIIAAVPPRSKRRWRLDLAVPLRRMPGTRFEARLSSEDATRTFWNEPRDVARSRERTVPTSIFTWP